ncbi:hypothetical protein GDO78_016187, partial [Eleutherodactylus coqui]
VIYFLPEPIKDLSNTSITINCTGKNEENDRLLGARQYFPSLGSSALGTIDLMYFPYYGNRAQVSLLHRTPCLVTSQRPRKV